MAATNFRPVQPIVKAVETVGEIPLVYNPHQAPGRSKLQQNIQETHNQEKKIYQKPKKKPYSEKNQKYQIRRRNARESPSATKAFNDPQP